jgi:hypothetical protein
MPYPGSEDAGVPASPAAVAEPPSDAPLTPPPEPPLETRTLDAVPPPLPPPEELDARPPQVESTGPSAMLDGHPREGAFLSGPGSVTFLMHHTLMTGLGVLATQMIPRALGQGPDAFGSEGARIAYLAGGLGGAAIGFAGSAVWQFTHWMSERTANFGIINSFFGGMCLGATCP